MAPVIKTDFQPAVSLHLVKSSSQSQDLELTNVSSSGDTTGLSREQLMQMIYALMLLVGENMSIIQTTYAQSQLEQDKIAQNQASATQIQTDAYLVQLNKLIKKQETAEKWGLFGKIMKWVGVVVGLILGALLCETPAGFLVLAAVIGFTASPLFDKCVSALGGAIGKAIGNTTAGNILAQVFILVIVTVITCGAEGLSTGLSKLASTATDDAIENGTQAASQISKQVSQEVTQQLTEEVTEQTSSQTSKISEEASSTAKSFKPRWSYASAAVFTQTLMSTNLVQEVLSTIPGVQKHEWAQILVDIASVLAELAIAAGSFQMAASTGNILNTVQQQFKTLANNPILLRAAIGSFAGLTQIISGAAQAGQGYNQYEQSLIQKEIAPLQAQIEFGQNFFQIWINITKLAQQSYTSLMNANTILFNTNFSADWQACVAAQQYQG